MRELIKQILIEQITGRRAKSKYFKDRKFEFNGPTGGILELVNCSFIVRACYGKQIMENGGKYSKAFHFTISDVEGTVIHNSNILTGEEPFIHALCNYSVKTLIVKKLNNILSKYLNIKIDKIMVYHRYDSTLKKEKNNYSGLCTSFIMSTKNL